MQPDEARRADARAWLAKAGIDLRAAAIDFAAEPPLLEDVLFHCQQTVEKAFKALLTWHDQPFRRTHSLEELGRQVADLHPELADVARRASLLTEYAWKYRYPGDVDAPTDGEANEALALAREAHGAVLGAIGERLF